MARTKINDIREDRNVSKEEMKSIMGGIFSRYYQNPKQNYRLRIF